MDFGLGLVLSFTDNASSGMQGAINTLNQMTETASNASNSLNSMAQLGAFSVVADQMGSSFVSAGQNILSTFTQVVGKVNETGQTLMYAENQLDKLYENSTKKGKDVLGDISQYAKQSIFEFEDLIPVVTMLKANGIEAFDMIASSTGKANQTLMDYAADLAAFNPQMRNAYGTGIKAAMGALNEYIAEGNAMSLKRGASLDITALLGEDKGATIEERSRQVADLMEKLNMVGMTAQLAETPMVKLSNMSDTLFQFLGMISQSGVYDKFNDIIGVFADFVNKIPDKKLQKIADSIGSALTDLLKPVEALAKKLVTLAKGFTELVSNNPAIAKFAILGTTITGVLLVLSGIALKLASSFGMLTIGLSTFGSSFGAITTLLKSGSLKLLSTLLPLTATIGLIYLAWKNDFGGIRTLLTNFVSNLQSAFSQARNATQMNVNGMMGVVNQLENKGDFWSNFTAGLIKVKTVFDALVDAWGDYTLSEEMFQKCKELGILPLIEAVLDFKWRWEHFVAGFKTGVDSVVTSLVNFGKGLTDNLKGTIFDTLIEKVTQFFKLLTNNDPEAWTRMGEIVGQLTAKLVLAGVALKVFKGVVGKIMGVVTVLGKLWGVVSKIGTLFSRIGTLFRPLIRGITKVVSLLRGGAIAPVTRIGQLFVRLGGIVSRLGSAFSTFAGVVQGALTGLAAVVGLPVEAVVAIIVAAVGSIVAFAVTHWEEFKSKVTEIWTTIKEEASAIWGSIKDGFISILNNLQGAIQPLVEKFNEFRNRLVSFGEWIISTPAFKALAIYFIEVGRVLTDTLVPAIQSILHIVSTVLQSVWNVVVNIFNAIVNIVTTTLGSLMDIISGVLDIIVGIFTLDFGKIFDGARSVFEGVYNFVSTILSNLWNVIGSILGGIADIFVSIFEGIYNTVKGWVDGIFDAVTEVLSGISETAGQIVQVVKTGFDSAIEFITALPGRAVQWGKDFIGGLVDGIKGAMGTVTDAVSGVADTISSFLHFSVPDKGALTEYESWMPDFMQGLADSITNSEQVVISAIDGFAEKIRSSLTEEAMQSFITFGTQWTQQMQVIVASTQQMQTGVVTSFQNIIKVITTMNTTTGNVVTAFTKLIQGFTQISSGSTNAGKSYSVVMKSMLSSTQTTTTGLTTLYTKLVTSFTTSLTTMARAEQTQFSAMAKTASTTFSSMASSISSAMQRAVSAVHSAVGTMKSAMNFQWSLPHLKVPHINVSGKFNVDPPSAPKFDVNWYAKGGVFDEPSVIGVGEQGKEAVMPLENNTGWIKDLAYMLSAQIVAMKNSFEPVSNTVNNEGSTTSSDSYMTSNVTNDNSNTETHNDNSVVFNEGAIQIICNNASEEEAIRMAKIIMEYIKRQKEVDKMLAYG